MKKIATDGERVCRTACPASAATVPGCDRFRGQPGPLSPMHARDIEMMAMLREERQLTSGARQCCCLLSAQMLGFRLKMDSDPNSAHGTRTADGRMQAAGAHDVPALRQLFCTAAVSAAFPSLRFCSSTLWPVHHRTTHTTHTGNSSRATTWSLLPYPPPVPATLPHVCPRPPPPHPPRSPHRRIPHCAAGGGAAAGGRTGAGIEITRISANMEITREKLLEGVFKPFHNLPTMELVRGTAITLSLCGTTRADCCCSLCCATKTPWGRKRPSYFVSRLLRARAPGLVLAVCGSVD